MISNMIAVTLAILFIVMDIKIFPYIFRMTFSNKENFKDKVIKAATPDFISIIKGKWREDWHSENVIQFFLGVIIVCIFVEGLIVFTFWKI